MHLSALQWSLILAGIGFQLAIAALMIKRKLRATFPLFFAFVVFGAMTQVVAVATAYISYTTYYYTFWTVMTLQTLLSFAVIYEVFLHILKPYSALVDFSKLLFKWAVVFLALVSTITAFATAGSMSDKACTTIQLLGRSSELMQCGLLLLFALFESRLGLSWRSPAISVIVGLGANSAFSLLSSFLGERLPDWNNALNMTGAVISVAVYATWYISMVLPQPVRRTAQDSPTRLVLQRWNEALLASPLTGRRGEVIAMTPIESFLPGVERTVERVMARKMMH